MSDLTSRVAALEAHTDHLREDMADIKPRIANIETLLARIDARLDSFATKEDLASISSKVSNLDGKLDGKLGFWQFLAVSVGLVTLAVTVLVAWDEIAKVVTSAVP